MSLLSSDRTTIQMLPVPLERSIAAEHLGYAKVVLEQAIARGDSGCRVVVSQKPSEAAQQATGREYFKG